MLVSPVKINSPVSIHDHELQNNCLSKNTLLTETMSKLKFSEDTRSNLETQISKMQAQLMNMESQLRNYQSELKNARASASKHRSDTFNGKINTNKPLKRSVRDMTSDAKIGTPDGGATRKKRASTKRGIIEQTFIGEKSLFSITPFLNRTLNLETENTRNELEISKDGDKCPPVQKSSINDSTKSNNIEVSCDSSPPISVSVQTQKIQLGKKISLKGALKNKTLKNPEVPRLESSRHLPCTGNLEIVAEDVSEQDPPMELSLATEPNSCPSLSEANSMGTKIDNIDTTQGWELKKKQKSFKLLKKATDPEIQDESEAMHGPALKVHRILGKEKHLKTQEKSIDNTNVFSPLKRNRRVGGSRIQV